MNASPMDVGVVTAEDDLEGPGSQLREARHRANFSLQEVCSQLHLNADTVRALEENAFDGLPAPAFVRGYMRSYARLLNLPPGPILEAYDRKGFAAPTIVPDIAQPPQAKSTDIPVRLATYLVAAGLMVMVIMWWQSREAPPAAGTEIAQAAGAPARTLPEATASVGSAAEPSERQAKAEVAGRETGEPGFRAGTGLATIVPGPLAAASNITPVPVDPAPPAVLDPLENEQTASSAFASAAPIQEDTETPDAETPEPANLAMGTDLSPTPAVGNGSNARLDLTFEKESWVEVYDGNGDRLVYRLAAGGERMTLDAGPPIRVVLGYAAGAMVSLNGRTLDFSPFMDRGMARFVVAADGATRAPASADDQETVSAAPDPQQQN